MTENETFHKCSICRIGVNLPRSREDRRRRLGVVYKAEDSLHRFVALKFLSANANVFWKTTVDRIVQSNDR